MSDTSVMYQETRLAQTVKRLCEPDIARHQRRDVNVATAIGTGVVMIAGALAATKLSFVLFEAICIWTAAAVAFFWFGGAPSRLVGLGSVSAMFEDAHRAIMDDLTAAARTMGITHAD